METSMEPKPKISIDTFLQTEITVGKILSVEQIEGSPKLLKLSVDFAEDSPRQILSGIRKYFPEEQTLVGRKCLFVTNLEPRVMMGMESNGMLFALSDDAGNFSLLEPNDTIPVGTKAH
jgi:methionyl-tRNA synthetase